MSHKKIEVVTIYTQDNITLTSLIQEWIYEKYQIGRLEDDNSKF